MSAESLSAKATLRREARAQGQIKTAAEREAASVQICNLLQASNLWQTKQSILLYSPLPDEPDVRPLIAAGLASGKRISLPCYDAERQVYAASVIEDLARDCVPGRYGIIEPAGNCQRVDLLQLDLVLVPGVSFDASGRRLGRGKGYYDRLLAQAGGIKCGVAFEWQVVSEVPAEPHDVCLNCILTPIRWLKV
jgi:5-formyltetrahydrofolate cyclo-ligase